MSITFSWLCEQRLLKILEARETKDLDFKLSHKEFFDFIVPGLNEYKLFFGAGYELFELHISYPSAQEQHLLEA